MKTHNHSFAIGFVIQAVIALAWLGRVNAAEIGSPTISTKPNVLFLFADDQRADTIGAHGNPHIKTPNLDQLAASGISFHRNYLFGGNSGAVCITSRAMLMSGKTWFNVDTRSLKGAKLFPELLREEGYTTFGTGKWHNGKASWLRCFDQGTNILFGGMSDHSLAPVCDLRSDMTFSDTQAGAKFSSELFADSVIEFLHNQDHKKPFFAYVAFSAPHDPRMAPLRYRDPYYQNLPPAPKNFAPQFPFDNGMMRVRDENLAAWPRTEPVVREQLAEYYALITHMDEQIGRIIKTLKESGKADNTIVIFTSDNGLAIGSHGLLGKQNVFEHSVRVPLIISGPSIPANKSTNAFTYLFDLYPTLCDLLSIESPKGLEGESLVPIIQDPSEKVRDSVFLPFTKIQRAVRDDRWKLICYPRISHQQLYDLQTDPRETINLIDHPKHKPHVARLQKLMTQWQAKVGDRLEVPSENKAPKAIDLTGAKRVADRWQPNWIVKKYFDQDTPRPKQRTRKDK